MPGDVEEMIHQCHSIWVIRNIYNSGPDGAIHFYWTALMRTQCHTVYIIKSSLFCLLLYSLLLFNYHVNTSLLIVLWVVYLCLCLSSSFALHWTQLSPALSCSNKDYWFISVDAKRVDWIYKYHLGACNVLYNVLKPSESTCCLLAM